MFLIEKCLSKDANAKYSSTESHLWIPAWSRGKSFIEKCSVDKAISTFHQMTSRVRSAPYRIRTLTHDSVTLAAINTPDSNLFRKFSIFSIGFFNDNKVNLSTSNVSECIGVVAPNSCGVIVGATSNKNKEVKSVVDKAASLLSLEVISHTITTRYNSDGGSGGAWLVTSATDGILSNSEVGITYSMHSKLIKLKVSNKFLSCDTSGNRKCPWTGRMDHESSHDCIEEAIVKLRMIARIATKEELELLVA